MRRVDLVEGDLPRFIHAVTEIPERYLAVDGDMALPLVASLRVENGGVASDYLLH